MSKSCGLSRLIAFLLLTALAPVRADQEVVVNVVGAKTLTAPGNVSALAVSFGRRIAAGLEDGRLVIWDDAQADPRVLKAHKDKINAVRFSADGALLATASNDGQIGIWKSDTLSRADHFRPDKGPKALTLDFSSDGAAVAAGYDNGAVKVWSVNDAGPVRVFARHKGKVLAVAFKFRDDNTLITLGEDKTLAVWNIATGEKINDVNLVSLGESDGNTADLRYRSAAVASEGKQIAIAAMSTHVLGDFSGIVEEHYIKLVNAATGSQTAPLADSAKSVPKNPNSTLALSADGSLLAFPGQSQGQSHQVQVWDLHKRLPIGDLALPSAVVALQFGWQRDGLRLVTAGGKEVKIFPVTYGSDAAPPVTLAVLDLDSDDPKLSVVVADFVRDAVSRRGGYVLVARGSMKEVLPKEIVNELVLSESGLVGKIGRVELGKVLNAKKILKGSLQKVGEEYSLSLKLEDVETGTQLTKTGLAKSASLADLAALAQQLTNDLLQSQNSQ